MPHAERPTDWLTTGDVARLVGVSSEIVRVWERAGKLDCERTQAGIRLFRRVDVDAFLAKRAREGHR